MQFRLYSTSCSCRNFSAHSTLNCCCLGLAVWHKSSSWSRTTITVRNKGTPRTQRVTNKELAKIIITSINIFLFLIEHIFLTLWPNTNPKCINDPTGRCLLIQTVAYLLTVRLVLARNKALTHYITSISQKVVFGFWSYTQRTLPNLTYLSNIQILILDADGWLIATWITNLLAYHYKSCMYVCTKRV